MAFHHAVKNIFIGKRRDPEDPKIFHKISLIAFFAWVGLGSDGLSSSCYGPSEVMLALGHHTYLGLYIAIGTVITIFVISSSYSQIVELFPSGGGGYLVASKLLSPYVGMVSGCALLIDYVLTITVSIASGADALFSFLPPEYRNLRLIVAMLVVALLTILNLRGVKESVGAMMPIFLIFVGTHIFIIGYAVATHLFNLPTVVSNSVTELSGTYTQLGFIGTFMIIMHAYSMGAGTYTGIEAVANGMPILKDPKVKTAKVTMRYMAVSLSITAFGLMLSYLLFDVKIAEGKTLNAILFETATSAWDPSFSYPFIIITLISEAAILFVAAQTGFLDGPRVLSNMALDKWVPSSFASLSDRLVTQRGILLMGTAALILMLATNGSVTFLLVLYSINVFIDFFLSQLGMVKHWIQSRKVEPKWKKRIIVNGIGLTLTTFILVSIIIVKFFEGGWITLLITGTAVTIVFLIKRHYNYTSKLIKKVNSYFEDIEALSLTKSAEETKNVKFDPNGRTAVLLVNGFSGIGIHSLLSIFRLFGDTFKNYAFIQIGVIDVGNFKGAEAIEEMKEKNEAEALKYVNFMRARGYYGEAFTSYGLDVEEEIMKLVPIIKSRFRTPIFFAGQIVFKKDSFINRLLHNSTVFSLHRKLYYMGLEFIVLPVKLQIERV